MFLAETVQQFTASKIWQPTMKAIERIDWIFHDELSQVGITKRAVSHK